MMAAVCVEVLQQNCICLYSCVCVCVSVTMRPYNSAACQGHFSRPTSFGKAFS